MELNNEEPLKITNLRKNIFAVFDQAAKTGRPVEIEKNGEIFTLLPPVRKSKLSNLKSRKLVMGNSDDIDKVQAWEWNPDDND